MRRLHLFEWCDQPWLPAVLRDYITDHLRAALGARSRHALNRAMAQQLKDALAASGARRLVDLCSGGGGPLLAVHRILADELGARVDVVLTDLYPNVPRFREAQGAHGGAVTAHGDPVAADAVPEALDGLRTLFTALHHFEPDAARAVLADAVAQRQPIAAFEPLERTVRMAVFGALDMLWRAFLLTPAVGRPSLGRLLLTYVVPVAPVLLLWDATVSALRTYTPEELRSLARSVGARGYAWQAGRYYVGGPLGLPLPAVYLIGVPTDKLSPAAGV